MSKVTNLITASLETIEQEVEVSATFLLEPDTFQKLLDDTSKGDFHYQAEYRAEHFRFRVRKTVTALNETTYAFTSKIPNPQGGDTEVTHELTAEEFETYLTVFPKHLYKQRRYLFVKTEDGTQLRWELDLLYDISKSRSNPELTHFVKVDLELGDYRGPLPKFPYPGKRLERHEARTLLDNVSYTHETNSD